MLAPWSDALYACDGKFWLGYPDALDFAGLKVTQTAKSMPGVHRVKVDPHSTVMAFDRFGELAAGGNSGFQAVNLAAQAGAARIVLVGFDYNAASGLHWHGSHPPGMNNPSQANLSAWRANLDGSAALLASLGVDVVNVSPQSSLTAFRRATLSESLK